MELRSALDVETINDPAQSARAVGLRYVTDETPGFSRVKRGRDFVYRDERGRPLRNPAQLRRIRSLAIPPAWTQVWICPLENGHLQATGRDARGRKQYRYHPRWREVRDDTKFNRMIAFARALPRMRRAVERDLKLPGLARRKVLAAVVRLLETTFIRVGNEEYARDNKSYGLTTLQDRHADVNGARIRLRFRGKSARQHTIDLHDPHLAAIVRQCQDLPGQELLQYQDDDGSVQDVKSEDVNEYLRDISGEDFTAKDFRTWAGTVLAAQELCARQVGETKRQTRAHITGAVNAVAERLGNTPAVCRKCYVHPAVIEAYQNGNLAALPDRRNASLNRARGKLTPEEEALLCLLQKSLQEKNEPLERKLERSLVEARRRSPAQRK